MNMLKGKFKGKRNVSSGLMHWRQTLGPEVSSRKFPIEKKVF